MLGVLFWGGVGVLVTHIWVFLFAENEQWTLIDKVIT